MAVPAVLDGVPVAEILDAGYRAADGCEKGLHSVTVPQTLCHSGYSAVAGNRRLQTIHLSHVREIAAGAFENCVKVNNVTIPYECESIAERAFAASESSSLFRMGHNGSLTLGSGLRQIAADAFAGADFEKVTFLGSEIPEMASGAMSMRGTPKFVVNDSVETEQLQKLRDTIHKAGGEIVAFYDKDDQRVSADAADALY